MYLILNHLTVVCKYLRWYFFLPMNFLTSFGIYSTPKLSTYVTLPSFTYESIQRAPIDLYSSRFIIYALSFIWINTGKYRFVLIIFFYLKISQSMRQYQNSAFVTTSVGFLFSLLSLLAIFLINKHLMY